MDEWPKNPYVNVLVEWQCSFTVMLSWDTAQGRKIRLALLFQRFQFIVTWITWVWTWHETKHPGREHEVQQSCLPCNEQQAVGVRQDQEQDTHFKVKSPVTYFLHSGSTGLASTTSQKCHWILNISVG